MSNNLSVRDRTILITGASRGLGRVMALGLLEAGARVALASTGPSGPLDATLAAARERASPDQFKSVFGDVRRYEDCVKICAEAVATFGQIDVLINNAAIPMAGEGPPFWEIAPRDWVRMTQTNCDSVFFMSRAAVPAMMARGSGKIVNISTSERTMVRPRYSPYGPSKTFVEACSRIWAQELKGTAVTVNVLSPGGAIDTAADVSGVVTEGKAFLPASVMVAPTLWLCSAASDGISGDRFVASLWKDELPLAERIAAARQCGAESPRIM